MDGVKAASANRIKPPGKKEFDNKPIIIADRLHKFWLSHTFLKIKYEYTIIKNKHKECTHADVKIILFFEISIKGKSNKWNDTGRQGLSEYSS